VVGPSGDFDASGQVAGADFLLWQRGFSTTTGAQLSNGDSDLDGDVDDQDLAIWRQQFASTSTLVPGDGDVDGDVDGSDFLTWQRGLGATTGASPATGDWDANGIVDGQDLNLWQQNFSGSQAVSYSSAFPQNRIEQETLLSLTAVQVEATVQVEAIVLRPTTSTVPSTTTPSIGQVVTPRDLAFLSLVARDHAGRSDFGHRPAVVQGEAASMIGQQRAVRWSPNTIPPVSGQPIVMQGHSIHRDMAGPPHHAMGQHRDQGAIDRALELFVGPRWITFR
jgi:hypothetical protein